MPKPSSQTPNRRASRQALSPPYERSRDLPRLIPVWPWEVSQDTPEIRAAIAAKLRRALVGERQRGLSGHWSYDLARHARLLAAYRAEIARTRAADAIAARYAERAAVRAGNTETEDQESRRRPR
jgi:hypothetical protein